MKTGKKNKIGKTSKQSIIRLAQIHECNYNEIFPKIITSIVEIKKKFKKKKQTNFKRKTKY